MGHRIQLTADWQVPSLLQCPGVKRRKRQICKIRLVCTLDRTSNVLRERRAYCTLININELILRPTSVGAFSIRYQRFEYHFYIKICSQILQQMQVFSSITWQMVLVCAVWWIPWFGTILCLFVFEDVSFVILSKLTTTEACFCESSRWNGEQRNSKEQ